KITVCEPLLIEGAVHAVVLKHQSTDARIPIQALIPTSHRFPILSVYDEPDESLMICSASAGRHGRVSTARWVGAADFEAGRGRVRDGLALEFTPTANSRVGRVASE